MARAATTSRERLHIQVQGLVQGVGFRPEELQMLHESRIE